MKNLHLIDKYSVAPTTMEWHKYFATTTSIKKWLEMVLKKYIEKRLTFRPATALQWRYVEVLNSKTYPWTSILKTLKIQLHLLRATNSISAMKSCVINDTNDVNQSLMYFLGLCPVWEKKNGRRTNIVTSLVDGLDSAGCTCHISM